MAHPNTNNKKRSAPASGSAGQFKKTKFGDNKSQKPKPKDVKGKGKASVPSKKPVKTYRNVDAKPAPVPKRKTPLTSTAAPKADDDEDDDEMDVDGSEDDEEEDVEMEESSPDVSNGRAQDGASGGEPNKRMSKGELLPWICEISANIFLLAERQALHATQPHRTTKLPSHPLLQDKLLPLWEEARKADITKEERQAAIKQLWEAVKGRVGEVARGHKGGRVLQTVSPSLPAILPSA